MLNKHLSPKQHEHCPTGSTGRQTTGCHLAVVYSQEDGTVKSQSESIKLSMLVKLSTTSCSCRSRTSVGETTCLTWTAQSPSREGRDEDRYGGRMGVSVSDKSSSWNITDRFKCQDDDDRNAVHYQNSLQCNLLSISRKLVLLHTIHHHTVLLQDQTVTRKPEATQLTNRAVCKTPQQRCICVRTLTHSGSSGRTVSSQCNAPAWTPRPAFFSHVCSI